MLFSKIKEREKTKWYLEATAVNPVTFLQQIDLKKPFFTVLLLFSGNKCSNAFSDYFCYYSVFNIWNGAIFFFLPLTSMLISVLVSL